MTEIPQDLSPEVRRYIDDLIQERNALASKVAILEGILEHVNRYINMAQAGIPCKNRSK